MMATGARNRNLHHWFNSLWPGEIHELRERERKAGIKPDLEVDAFMKASVRRGKRHNIRTDYVLRLLGLEVRPQFSCPAAGHIVLLSVLKQALVRRGKCHNIRTDYVLRLLGMEELQIAQMMGARACHQQVAAEGRSRWLLGNKRSSSCQAHRRPRKGVSQCCFRAVASKLRCDVCFLSQVCANTLIGSHLVRGISGGQKKRVTTGKHPVATTYCRTAPPSLFLQFSPVLLAHACACWLCTVSLANIVGTIVLR